MDGTVSAVHAERGSKAQRGHVSMGALRRLPLAVPQHRRPHPSGDPRDRAARSRAADHRSERDRPGCGASQRASAQRPHPRAGDHPCVHPADDADAGNAGELHAAQPRLRDDLAVLPPHPVLAPRVLQQAPHRRHLRALPGEHEGAQLSHRVDDQHAAERADDVHLLHRHVPLQREAQHAADRIPDSARPADGRS